VKSHSPPKDFKSSFSFYGMDLVVFHRAICIYSEQPLHAAKPVM